jgi:RNA polymerase sigma-70 factor (ECF subfamily)
VEGRRVGDRRQLVVAVDAPTLPRRARPYADRLVFVERLEPPALKARDAESHRLVLRFQAGDTGALDELYLRYFDDVFTYARVALGGHHEAEDVTQDVFLRMLRSLERYEVRPGTPFRGWLFRIARNVVVDAVKRQQRVRVEEDDQLLARVEDGALADVPVTLEWLNDREVALLVERLPDTQRQVLVLRYMLSLNTAEIAQVMDKSVSAVRQMHSRALRSLEVRLAALRRGATETRRAPMLVRLKPMPVMVRRRFALGPPRR